MIITRSPLRISRGGGGTHLPSYYRRHAGFVISAAIDKYVYITLPDTFVQAIDMKYPIVREALKLVQVGTLHLEITSMANNPAGTGRDLPAARRKRTTFPGQELAEEAYHIEMNLLGEPVGKQDRYIASFGGIMSFHFLPDDSVEVTPFADSHQDLA